MLLLTLTLLSAAPVKPLPMLAAPLGRLGNVVEEAPTGGTPGGEKTLVGKLDGCEREQAFYLSRFLAGTLTAVQQLQDWMALTPGLERKLFAAGKLGEVAQLVAASAASEQKLCAAPALAEGFKLAMIRSDGKQCAADSGFRTGDFWWAKDGKQAAALAITPAAAEGKDRCRPRISVVLFDKKGVARIRLHADYGGVASVTLLGDKCVGLDFNFETSTQTFVPTWRPAKSCKS